MELNTAEAVIPNIRGGRAVSRLKERFPENEYVTAATEKTCDVWIIVCGCQRACADHEMLTAGKKKFVAAGERSFDEISDYLAFPEGRTEILEECREGDLNWRTTGKEKFGKPG